MSKPGIAECKFMITYGGTNSKSQGPHSHILMTGGGWGPSDFFGSEILVQSDSFGSMKDAGILLGRKKKSEGFFWGCEKRIKGFFWVCKKKVVIFLGRQILKL